MPRTIHPETQKQLDEIEVKMFDIEANIENLKREKVLLERQIDALVCGESPIKIKDHIYWNSGKARRHGIVLSVSTERWNCQYIYRCKLYNSKNEPVGFSNVTALHEPSLEKDPENLIP